MHGETIKVIDAQQAKYCNIYKNTKLKLLKTNAAIWFNKICRETRHPPHTQHMLLHRPTYISSNSYFCNFIMLQF
jgi:hypothetical protein